MESLYLLNDCLQKKDLPSEIRKIIISYVYTPRELANLILEEIKIPEKDKNIDLFLIHKQELCKKILYNSGYKFITNEWIGRYSFLLSTIINIIDTFKRNRNYTIDLDDIKDTLEYIRSHSLLEDTEIPFDVKDFVAKNALNYDQTIEKSFEEKLENIIKTIANGNSENVKFELSMMSVLGKNYIKPEIKYEFVKNIIKYTTQEHSDDYKIQCKLLDTFIIYDGYCIDVRYVIKEAIHQSNLYIVNNYVKINSALLTYTLGECIKQDNLEIFKTLLCNEIVNRYQSYIDIDHLTDYCLLYNTNLEFIHRLCRFKKLQEQRYKHLY